MATTTTTCGIPSTGKKTAKTLQQTIVSNLATSKYTCIKMKPGTNTRVKSDCVISGSKAYWGDGKKQDHSMVYYPALRIAGTSGLVQEYLRQYAQEAPQEGSFKQHWAGVLTRDNHTSQQPVNARVYSMNPETSTPILDKDNHATYTVQQVTYAQLYNYELDQHTACRARNTGCTGVASLPSLDVINCELNSFLQRLGISVPSEQRKGGGAGSSGGRTKKAGGGAHNKLIKKLQEVGPTKSLNITKYNPVTHGGTRIISYAVPASGVRLSSSSPLSYVYFNRETDGKVPTGVPAFLKTIGMPESEVNALLQQIMASAARTAAPGKAGGLFAAPQVQPQTQVLSFPQPQAQPTQAFSFHQAQPQPTQAFSLPQAQVQPTQAFSYPQAQVQPQSPGFPQPFGFPAQVTMPSAGSPLSPTGQGSAPGSPTSPSIFTLPTPQQPLPPARGSPRLPLPGGINF